LSDVDPDTARFERVRAQTLDRVTGYIQNRVPPNEAADVVSETYLVAWRRRAELPEHALPWLLVVARNTLAQQRRGNGRNAALAAEVERLHHLLPTTESDVAAEVTERITVLAALDSLSPADREVLVLSVWDGLPARQAAQVLGCSPAAFTVRLHRARGRLARAMTAQDADDPDPGVAPGPRRGRATTPTLEEIS